MSLKELNKKGDMKYIVGILLIIIGFIAILPVVIDLFSKGNDISSRSTCQNSFMLKSKSEIPVVGPNIELACTTYEYNIESADIVSVQKAIAEELYYCWWQSGKGKVDLDKWRITSPGYTCFICAEIRFSEGMLKNFPESQKIDMASYLNSYFIPGSNKQTYSDYFLGEKEGFNSQNIRNDLTFSDKIFVVFKFDKTLIDFKAKYALEDEDSIAKNCNSVQNFKVSNKKSL